MATITHNCLKNRSTLKCFSRQTTGLMNILLFSKKFIILLRIESYFFIKANSKLCPIRLSEESHSEEIHFFILVNIICYGINLNKSSKSLQRMTNCSRLKFMLICFYPFFVILRAVKSFNMEFFNTIYVHHTVKIFYFAGKMVSSQLVQSRLSL